jgi:hypothetical protein
MKGLVISLPGCPARTAPGAREHRVARPATVAPRLAVADNRVMPTRTPILTPTTGATARLPSARV